MSIYSQSCTVYLISLAVQLTLEQDFDCDIVKQDIEKYLQIGQYIFKTYRNLEYERLRTNSEAHEEKSTQMFMFPGPCKHLLKVSLMTVCNTSAPNLPLL